MSFAARLVHRLAIISTGTGGDATDVEDLDAYGDAEAGADETVLVPGLVQPRTTREIETFSQTGPEIGSHVIYLLRRAIPSGAHIVDADESGPLAGGRRFEVVGVRDFDFGRSPHLEVDVRLVGESEAPQEGS